MKIFVLKRPPTTHINMNSIDLEHLDLVFHGRHESEELLTIFVPLDRVKFRIVQIIITAQPGGLTQY